MEDPSQQPKAAETKEPSLALPIGTAKGTVNTMHYTDSNGVSHSITPQPIRPSEPNKIFYTDENGVEHSIDLPPPTIINQSSARECNEMTYTDDRTGVERRIYLPQGTLHTAWEHLENKRWEELDRFEEWEDQGYSEEDDFKTYERGINKDKSGGGGGN